MRPVLVIPPAIVGLLLLYLGITSMAHDLQYYSESSISVVRGAIPPIAIGAGLLLAALAVWRRSRAGYLLGLVAAGLMLLGGVVLIAMEIQSIVRDVPGAEYAWVFIVAAGIWMALWASYVRSVGRARGTFDATWKPIDRRYALVLGAFIVFAAAAHIGLGVVQAAAATAGAANQAQAEQLVQRTTLVVEASDVTLDPSVTGPKPAVESMHLDVSVHSLATYALASEPTLCLTDLSTANDPAFKPDVYCWGGAGRALAVNTGFPGLQVQDGTSTFELDVGRAEGLCAFGPGRWMAELRLVPRLATADGSGANVASFAVWATFMVRLNGQPEPDDPSAPTTDCISPLQGAPAP